MDLHQHDAELRALPSGRTPARSARPLETTTFAGALTLRGFIAPPVVAEAISRDAFEVYVIKVLAPESRADDIVLTGQPAGQKGPRVREMTEAAGLRLLYLPPSSPVFIPIETPVRN